MDTLKTKKKNEEQITFKDAGIFAALKRISENNGNSGIGPEAKKLLKDAIENLDNPRKETPSKEIPQEKTIKQPQLTDDDEISISEKLDILAELISKLITSSEVSNDEAVEQRIVEETETAVQEHEEQLRSENLMLMLPPSIKDLFYKLLDFRKKKGKEYSDSVEQLFLFLFKNYIVNTWDSLPDDFTSELKQAVSDYLNPKDELEKEEKIVDKK